MKAKAKLIIAMLIWGSIGLFVRNIPLTSPELAFFRALLGSLFLLIMGLLMSKKQPLSIHAIKKSFPLLVASGIALSANWIFLFQAYRYTTVPIATLSYYFAPVFLVMVSPFIFKERLTSTHLTCIAVAMAGLGLILLNKQLDTLDGVNHTIGIGYGLLAACFYTAVVIINKFIKHLSGYETTLIQLISSTSVLMIYMVLSGGFTLTLMTPSNWLLVIILGIVHTGIAFLLFFSAIPQLTSQSLAILSYIDPISAMIFSLIFLHEGLTFIQLIGGTMVLGAAFYTEWYNRTQLTVSPHHD